MWWIRCVVIIGKVTGYTCRGNVGKGMVGMTSVTITDSMSQREREKGMINTCSTPIHAVHRMALNAVC